MSQTRVQGTTGTTGATFPTSLATTAFTTQPVNGNAILVAVIADGLAQVQPITVTDNAKNHYIFLGRAWIKSIDQVDIWCAWSVTGAASHVITAGNLANTTAAIVAEEWNGMPSLSSVDVAITAINNTGTSTTIASGTSAATIFPNEVLWQAAFISSSTVTPTVGSGFSNLTSVTSSPSQLFVQSDVASATGTQSGSMALSAGAQWGTVFVTIADTYTHGKVNANNYQFVRAPDGMSVSEKIR